MGGRVKWWWEEAYGSLSKEDGRGLSGEFILGGGSEHELEDWGWLPTIGRCGWEGAGAVVW